MKYDESANGKRVSAQVNDEFQIVLPETRMSGYHWITVLHGAPQCKLQEERCRPNPNGPGGSGEHSWSFRAIFPGTGNIQFHYQRSWNKEGPAKTFLLEVQVQP